MPSRLNSSWDTVRFSWIPSFGEKPFQKKHTYVCSKALLNSSQIAVLPVSEEFHPEWKTRTPQCLVHWLQIVSSRICTVYNVKTPSWNFVSFITTPCKDMHIHFDRSGLLAEIHLEQLVAMGVVSPKERIHPHFLQRCSQIRSLS